MTLLSTISFPREVGRPWLSLTGWLLLACGVLHAPQARAEFFQFSTSITIGAASPGTVDNTDPNHLFASLTTPGPSPGLQVITISGDESGSPGDNLDATIGGSDIVFGRISVASVTSTTPLQVINIPYTFSISVSDFSTATSVVPNDTELFTINGTITGTIGAGKKVNLSSNVYSPGNVLIKQIGNELYSLNLNFYVPPGPTNAGAFGAHIETTLVPEPSTLALASLGALAIATPAIRRWRGSSRRCG